MAEFDKATGQHDGTAMFDTQAQDPAEGSVQGRAKSVAFGNSKQSGIRVHHLRGDEATVCYSVVY